MFSHNLFSHFTSCLPYYFHPQPLVPLSPPFTVLSSCRWMSLLNILFVQSHLPSDTSWFHYSTAKTVYCTQLYFFFYIFFRISFMSIVFLWFLPPLNDCDNINSVQAEAKPSSIMEMGVEHKNHTSGHRNTGNCHLLRDWVSS